MSAAAAAGGSAPRPAFLLALALALALALSPSPARARFSCSPGARPVVFNFGDSNSDTGGMAAAKGWHIAPPEGRAFFHHPTGRFCDGRLVIDFLYNIIVHNFRYVTTGLLCADNHVIDASVLLSEIQRLRM
uniref:GDSL esterase/lipase LIP-4 n=1 Tax=Aegilops tauschii TaxID=37682 RepID=R7W5N3_AEGTA